MNDYLTSLAARALAPPAIQPRQGSLFEPAATPPGSAGPRRTVRQWGESHEETPETEPGGEDRGRLFPAPPRREEVQRRPAAEEAPPNHNQPVAPAVRPAPGWADAPVPAVPMATALPAPARAQMAPTVTHAPPVATPPRPPLDSRPRPERAREEDPPPKVMSGPARPAARRELTPVETADTRDAPAARRASDSPPVRSPFAPAVVAASQARSEKAATGSVSQPGPTTIRVTIGRVEVRAVTPPAAAPGPSRAAKSGARLSLEEYLKHRSGDRR